MPAALVATVGVLLLSNLARVSDTPPVPAAVETAINTEAVFKIIPREPVEEAPAEAKADAKRLAAGARCQSEARRRYSRPAIAQGRERSCSPAAGRGGSAADRANPEQPMTQIPEQPAAAAPDSENTVMGRLRSASTAVQRIPQWATRSVAGWFAADAPPPRPPEPVPAQNFQAGT